MKVIGFYNKHNNDFYGYVCFNEYVVLKNVENIRIYKTDKQDINSIKEHGRHVLSRLYAITRDGKDQVEYINEIFKYSKVNDVEVRVLDYNQIVRKYKLFKIKNR